jgi:protein TonB
MVEFTPTSTPVAAAAPQTAARRAWRWARRPTGEDLNKEFPERASAARRSGEVTLACLVQDEGALSCAVVSESPNGYRFGAAALRVMREARVATTLSNGESSLGAQITVPIHFEYRGNDAERGSQGSR